MQSLDYRPNDFVRTEAWIGLWLRHQKSQLPPPHATQQRRDQLFSTCSVV